MLKLYLVLQHTKDRAVNSPGKFFLQNRYWHTDVLKCLSAEEVFYKPSAQTARKGCRSFPTDSKAKERRTGPTFTTSKFQIKPMGNHWKALLKVSVINHQSNRNEPVWHRSSSSNQSSTMSQNCPDSTYEQTVDSIYVLMKWLKNPIWTPRN